MAKPNGSISSNAKTLSTNQDIPRSRLVASRSEGSMTEPVEITITQSVEDPRVRVSMNRVVRSALTCMLAI